MFCRISRSPVILPFLSFYYICTRIVRGDRSPLFQFIMDEQLKDKINKLLEPILGEKDWFLVDLKVLPGAVQVFIDSDNGVTIENCAAVNRGLLTELNLMMPFSDRYTLEVSSPGISQPLKVMRQYRKFTGKKVNVLMNNGIRKTGRMISSDENKILLEEYKTEKHREIVTGQTEIPFHNIKATTVVLNF